MPKHQVSQRDFILGNFNTATTHLRVLTMEMAKARVPALTPEQCSMVQRFFADAFICGGATVAAGWDEFDFSSIAAIDKDDVSRELMKMPGAILPDQMGTPKSEIDRN